MRATVLGIALVLGILGFLIFMGGYDIYNNPLRGMSFWEFLGPVENVYRRIEIAHAVGTTMMIIGSLI